MLIAYNTDGLQMQPSASPLKDRSGFSVKSK